MAQIKLNGEDLVQYGEEIKSMGGEFASILEDIHKLVNDINDAWDGLAADAYVESYESTKTTMAQLETAVEGIGETVVSVGNAWIETESQLASSNG